MLFLTIFISIVRQEVHPILNVMNLLASQMVFDNFLLLNFLGYVLLIITKGHGVITVNTGIHHIVILSFLPDVFDVKLVFILAVNNHFFFILAPDLAVLFLSEIINLVLHISSVSVEHVRVVVKLIRLQNLGDRLNILSVMSRVL